MAINKDLSISYMGTNFQNPFCLSSSPVGSNYEMVAKCFETGWGGVFYKTVGIFVADECSPRFDQTNKEGLPWLGFKNMEQISDKPTELNFENMYKLMRDYPDHVVIPTIMGSSEEEWKQLAKMCDELGAPMIEGNFSCPQMTSHAMGSDVGTNPELVKSYCEAVTSVTDIPFIAKMTPNNKNMEEPAIAAIQGGAASVSAINTIKSVTNSDFENMTAIALRFITNLLQCEELKGRDISGIGGIETWRDAAEFLALGCKNIQVTTAIMQYGYRIVEDMISGMSHFMEERGYEKLDDFIGMALPNIIPAEELNRDFKILPKFDDDKCVGCGRCYVSCYDGGHQAIDFNTETRRPELNENCVGCHLCLNVCPVQECITPGEIVWKEGRTPVDIKFKKHYE